MLKLVPASPDESGLFYSDKSKPPERACIGYLRGYYDNGGRNLVTSWFEHQSALKTQEFREEFDRFINDLRGQGILKDRTGLERFCLNHPSARIHGAWYQDTFGFRAESEKHCYYLRLSLAAGDYAIYFYSYNRDILRSQEQRMHTIKKSEPER